MARTAVLGLPPLGADRELKFALEALLGRAHRRAPSSRRPRARCARARPGEPARAAGIDVIPSGDFSALRPRARHGVALAGARRPASIAADAYFALARGTDDAAAARDDQVVRHQLPLPRAGARAREQALRAATPTTGPAHAARGGGAGHRRPARSCSARSRCCCSSKGLEQPLALLPALDRRSTRSCSRALAAAGAPRGPARRAVPRARPQRRRARRVRATAYAALARAPRRSASRPTSRPPSRARAASRAAAGRAAPRPRCARPSSSTPRSTRVPGRGCRSA